ncbi:MAG: threonine/serine dehydratase [Acidobacteria bacterium]|nr:threonine/serine dehydratase [Acidobacteriota bacterium]MBI3424618.1 threonine/serine dehydratase [Acidobacteriota bacterium]
MITAQATLTAAARIQPVIRTTPTDYSRALSELTGCHVWLKLEHLQHTGSFKLRGAANKLLSLSAEERARGVITASNGNHGIAVCYAARQLGVPVRVFMRNGVPELRVALIRALGGEPVFFGDDSLKAEMQARTVAGQRGQVFISPYNDAEVIAGQGTIGVELAEQLETLDAVFVAVGGGGLIAGIATYLKEVRPKVKIVGCWPENSPVLYECLKAGRIFDVPELPTLSDSTAGGVEPDALTFEPCQRLLDEHVLVSEDEIKHAMRLVLEKERWVIEGAAGVAVAALLKSAERFRGQHVVAVLCGRNIAAERLRELW